MMDAVDIFPRNISENVDKLQYPLKYFKYWGNDANIKPFILFLNEDNFVYYLKQQLNKQCLDAILQIGKKCQFVDKFDPKCINWNRIKHKLSQSPIDKMRKNADHRLGFKLKKHLFGQIFFYIWFENSVTKHCTFYSGFECPARFVHISKKIAGRVKIEEKIFPSKELHLYTQIVLMPNSAYRVPLETKYILFSTQKKLIQFWYYSE